MFTEYAYTINQQKYCNSIKELAVVYLDNYYKYASIIDQIYFEQYLNLLIQGWVYKKINNANIEPFIKNILLNYFIARFTFFSYIKIIVAAYAEIGLC